MIKKKPSLTKLQKIKLILSDIDGVLTDGSMYYSENGEFLKKFNTRDGMAVELLKKENITTILITKENSKISKSRAKKIKTSIYCSILKKEKILPKICSKYKVKKDEIAYIGDDHNDLEIIKQVGFSFSPNDATESVLQNVDYVCKSKGGNGAFREMADLILSSKNKT